jgi:hypothetical protein
VQYCLLHLPRFILPQEHTLLPNSIASMAQSSCGMLNSASTASSCFPSTGSSFTSESSETEHSTFARKSHGDTGIAQVSTNSGTSNSISTGEHHSSDIFSLSDQQLSEKLRFVKEVSIQLFGSRAHLADVDFRLASATGDLFGCVNLVWSKNRDYLARKSLLSSCIALRLQPPRPVYALFGMR